MSISTMANLSNIERTAIVTPMYQRIAQNGVQGISKTVKRLEKLAQEGYNVYLIDDFSTDGSQEWLKYYQENNAQSKLNIMFMTENGKKVKAIEKVVKNLPNYIDYVLSTDDDTALKNPENITSVIDMLEENGHAGTALKVIPSEIKRADFNNTVTLRDKIKYRIAQVYQVLQDVDYAHSRVWAGYTTSEKLGVEKQDSKIRCVAGAGGIFNRWVLQEALSLHTGKHNGDDFETTAKIMHLDGGYSVTYSDKITFETEVPTSYKLLFKQRTRWELGALETYLEERKFYGNQFLGLLDGVFRDHPNEVGKHRLAHTTAYEAYVWGLTPAFVYLTYDALVNNNTESLEQLAVFDTVYNFVMLGLAAKKKELRSVKKSLALLPAMFAYRALVTFPTKINAFQKFSRNETPKLAKTLVDKVTEATDKLLELEHNSNKYLNDLIFTVSSVTPFLTI